MSNVHKISTDIFRSVQVAFRKPGNVAIGALALVAGVNAAKAETPSPSLRGSALPVAEEAAHRSLAACTQVVPASCVNPSTNQVNYIELTNDSCCAGIIQNPDSTSAFNYWTFALLTRQTNGPDYCSSAPTATTRCAALPTITETPITFDSNSFTMITNTGGSITISYTKIETLMGTDLYDRLGGGENLDFSKCLDGYNYASALITNAATAEETAEAEVEITTTKYTLLAETVSAVYGDDDTSAAAALLKYLGIEYAQDASQNYDPNEFDPGYLIPILIITALSIALPILFCVFNSYAMPNLQKLLCCSDRCKTAGEATQARQALTHPLLYSIPDTKYDVFKTMVTTVGNLVKQLGHYAKEDIPAFNRLIKIVDQILAKPTGQQARLLLHLEAPDATAAIEAGSADGRPLDPAYADNE